MAAERERCLDCRAIAPETNTNYTLIGTSGWRVSRVQAADGTGTTFQWRCPACWRKHRAQASAKK